MKTYNAQARLSAQARLAIENAISEHERFKHCYFWGGNGNRQQCQRKNKYFSAGHPPFTVVLANRTLHVRPYFDVRRRYVDYSLGLTIETSTGTRKGTVRDLKKALNR